MHAPGPCRVAGSTQSQDPSALRRKASQKLCMVSPPYSQSLMQVGFLSADFAMTLRR
jgi:hypothetical protein